MTAAIFVLVVSAGACGGAAPTTSPTTVPTTSPTTTPPTNGGSITVNLRAANLQFDTNRITVPAGSSVTIAFVNDDAVLHNFALFRSRTDTTVIFRGALTGRGTVNYTFIAPAQPGTYFFMCEVHPTTMFGDFVVT